MLYRNDVFLLSGGRRMRLLSADPPTDRAWVFALDDDKALPEQVRLGELNDTVTERAAPGSATSTIATPRATQAARRKRAAAWERIKPLVDDPCVLNAAQRGPLLKHRAQELGCSPNTLMADLRRWWTGGQTQDALLAQYHRCGTTASDRGARGRPPFAARYAVFPLKPDDLVHIRSVIKKHYLADGRRSLPDTLQYLLEKHYSYVDGNGERYIRPAGERPTLKQVRRVLLQDFSLEGRLRARLGDKDFERDHRARLGRIPESCHGPGHYYEIDATIADVFLVSSVDRSKIVGKPTVYLIIDRDTRLIVGFYIGLESASWAAAMQAMLSICEDKRALCTRHGLAYDPSDWPADGLFPQQFVADRGEMISRASDRVCEGLEITVLNVPAKRPDCKPVVECGFRVLHAAIRDTAPGYEPPSNVTKRQGKAYDKDACLTLGEFSAMVLGAIIRCNRMPIRNLALTLAEVAAGQLPVPLELWATRSPARAGVLTRFDEQHVRHMLLPTDQATVTDAGIMFRGCAYQCTEAVKRGWYVRGRKARFDVTLSYDARLVDAIWIHDPNDKTAFVHATLLPRSREFQGFSFGEVAYFAWLRKLMSGPIEDLATQHKADFHRHSQPIAALAKRLTHGATQGKSRSARRADTKQAREDERRIERQQRGAPAQAPALGSPAAPISSVRADVVMLPAPAATANESPSAQHGQIQRTDSHEACAPHSLSLRDRLISHHTDKTHG